LDDGLMVLLRASRLRRDKGRQILDFGFWIMDWGEEKPNGEFWMLNDGLKTMVNFGLGSCSMVNFGCWILNGGFSIGYSKFRSQCGLFR
jgi:hypothetical protein